MSDARKTAACSFPVNTDMSDIISTCCQLVSSSFTRVYDNTHPSTFQNTMPNKHLKAGHPRPASKTPFQWRFAGVPMVARLSMLAGCVASCSGGTSWCISSTSVRWLVTCMRSFTFYTGWSESTIYPLRSYGTYFNIWYQLRPWWETTTCNISPEFTLRSKIIIILEELNLKKMTCNHL